MNSLSRGLNWRQDRRRLAPSATPGVASGLQVVGVTSGPDGARADPKVGPGSAVGGGFLPLPGSNLLRGTDSRVDGRIEQLARSLRAIRKDRDLLSRRLRAGCSNRDLLSFSERNACITGV